MICIIDSQFNAKSSIQGAQCFGAGDFPSTVISFMIDRYFFIIYQSFHITHIPIREVLNIFGIFGRYALETRPYDQGARLTTWECSTEGKSLFTNKYQSNKDKMFFLLSIFQYRKLLHAVH